MMGRERARRALHGAKNERTRPLEVRRAHIQPSRCAMRRSGPFGEQAACARGRQQHALPPVQPANWSEMARQGKHGCSKSHAFAMLCDTSYTTCMSRSSGVHVNILANAYARPLSQMSGQVCAATRTCLPAEKGHRASVDPRVVRCACHSSLRASRQRD